MLVDAGIVKFGVAEDTDYFQSQEFTALMGLVQEWYFRRYGESAKTSDRFLLKGIARFRNNPMMITFPQTTAVVEKEGESSWMVHSTHVEEYEDIGSYFASDLDLSGLSEAHYENLFQSIDKVVFLTRSIAISTLSDVSRLDDECAAMAKTVIRHIEKGVDDILELGTESAVSCWEFHLAIEKSFKIYIKQKSGIKVYGHDLNVLSETASKYNKQIDLEMLGELPTDKDAIKLRYAEMQLSIDRLIRIYLLTLEIVHSLTKDLDRTISIYNARILFKKPDWV